MNFQELKILRESLLTEYLKSEVGSVAYSNCKKALDIVEDLMADSLATEERMDALLHVERLLDEADILLRLCFFPLAK